VDLLAVGTWNANAKQHEHEQATGQFSEGAHRAKVYIKNRKLNFKEKFLFNCLSSYIVRRFVSVGLQPKLKNNQFTTLTNKLPYLICH
jgi:hypothetical protein